MITVNIREEDEFIKLGQALKKAGVVGSGVDAKMVILDGQVSVNGQTELQRVFSVNLQNPPKKVIDILNSRPYNSKSSVANYFIILLRKE